MTTLDAHALRDLAARVQILADASGGWPTVEDLAEPGDTAQQQLVDAWIATLSPAVVGELLDALAERGQAIADLTAPAPPTGGAGVGDVCLCGDSRRDHKTRFAYGQAVGGPCRRCGCQRYEQVADG